MASDWFQLLSTVFLHQQSNMGLICVVFHNKDHRSILNFFLKEPTVITCRPQRSSYRRAQQKEPFCPIMKQNTDFHEGISQA